MDLIAGLRWVQRNIGQFGGDPANVTILGQSAGSSAVALLQLSPEARGLFQRVIGMSGSPFGEPMGPVTLAQAESEGLALQKALGVNSIEAMRDLAGDRIIATQVPRAAIVMDGRYMVGPPSETMQRGLANDVPLMLGFTRDESFRPLGAINSVADYEAAIRSNFPGQSQAVLSAYPARNVDEAKRAAIDVSRDASVGLSMWNWASAQREFGKAPVYTYFFARRQPYTDGITFIDHDPATAGAYHTAEVPYFLRTRDALNLFRKTRTWEPVDQALEDDAAQLLLTFARGQAPSSPRIKQWPLFDAKRPKMVLLGPEVSVIDWPNHRALPHLRGASPPARPAPTGRPRD
jgi:para-nitrobenzyl esterase